jgi:hypothetical protein
MSLQTLILTGGVSNYGPIACGAKYLFPCCFSGQVDRLDRLDRWDRDCRWMQCPNRNIVHFFA